jgi:hypothetical protein
MTILEENRKSYDWKTIMEKALIWKIVIK